jgi:hypothetical protein
VTTDPRRGVRRDPWRGGALAWAALACAALGCFGTTRTRHGDRVDVSGYPPEIRSAYRVFALRCSRCHTLARPLNAHIRDPQHWVRYVTRMRRTPGSGINERDAQVILKFLLFYSAEERGDADGQGAEAPQRVAPTPVTPTTSAPARASTSTPAPTGASATPTTADAGVIETEGESP